MATQLKNIADAIVAKQDEIKDQRNTEMAASGNDSIAKVANVKATKEASMTAKSDERASDAAAHTKERTEKTDERDEAVKELKGGSDPNISSIAQLLATIEANENTITNNIVGFGSEIETERAAMEAAIGTEADVLAIFAPAPAHDAYFWIDENSNGYPSILVQFSADQTLGQIDFKVPGLTFWGATTGLIEGTTNAFDHCDNGFIAGSNEFGGAVLHFNNYPQTFLAGVTYYFGQMNGVTELTEGYVREDKDGAYKDIDIALNEAAA